ncbi:MAG: RsmB/NOP family class I SAM-dependent RNA methyltransferase [Acidilobaceae archaeon]
MEKKGERASPEARLLASVVHEIFRHRVSIDVAFKRVCRGACASGLEERERLYSLAWSFVRDYNALLCLTGYRGKPSKLAELWLSMGGSLSENALSEPHCRASVKKWFFDRIASLVGAEEALRLFQAMGRRVWWLRVNLFKASVERVLSQLEKERVDFEVSKHYPYMVKVLRSPKPVRLLKPVRLFEAIPQDIASVVVVEELKPEPGDVILDACAAPGVKTSLISMLTEGKAKIIAIDLSYKRIQAMRSLLRKLGVPEGSVEIRHGDSRRVRVEGVTKALVDAPCSNSGALSKDPGLRLTITQGKVLYYSRIQYEILSNVLSQVSDVVYSVCSIMPEEGESVVERVLERIEVGLKPPSSPLCREGYPSAYSSRVCRLYPHLADSEGFFVAHFTAN